MSDPTGHDAHGAHEAHGEHGHHGNYVRIWAILLALLVVSVAGPVVAQYIEHRHTALLLTLATAFGIAIVKAYMVAKNFMHIAFTRRFVTYLVMTMLMLMLVFFAGAAPDVMKLEGRNWEKPAWIQANEQAALHPAGGHGAGHGAEAAHP
jgi:caa(3)-type oxidase subunit IV